MDLTGSKAQITIDKMIEYDTDVTPMDAMRVGRRTPVIPMMEEVRLKT